MIFQITDGFVETVTGQQLSDICCGMMQAGQYISCDGLVYDRIRQAISDHGSTSQKELLRHFQGFDVTVELRKYLTTHVLDQHTSVEDLRLLIQLPGKVVVENGPYEWPVYERIIEAYKHDRHFKNLFVLLGNAVKGGRLVSLHGGGCSTFPALIDQKEKGEYRHVSRWKLVALFDRDTDDSSSFDSQKNGLFRFFLGKDHASVCEGDIYTLSQRGYTWHMWYKRAIENYFSDEQYVAQGIDTSRFPMEAEKRDYFKIDAGSATGYGKNKLPLLAEGMGRAGFERGLKQFDIGGQKISEMQLFLLKLVKVV